ncbi:MAG: alpha-ketoglutarate-dependent dioxygenase AlkB [Akkermansiaceae bacterium]
MDLFEDDTKANILPYDGEAQYFGLIFDERQSAVLTEGLLKQVAWEHDETHMFGKRIVTARKVAWFADGGITYAYSGSVKNPQEWTDGILIIKKQAEALTGEIYNSCLLNLYHNGGEGMGWHSDDEKCIEVGSSIASVSFGAERKFSFKHKRTKETAHIVLENGSLLEMRKETQRYWIHQLPKTKRVDQLRINLTFRKIV